FDGAAVDVVERGKRLRRREIVAVVFLRLAEGDVHALVAGGEPHRDVAVAGTQPVAVVLGLRALLVLALFRIEAGVAALDRLGRRGHARHGGDAARQQCDKDRSAHESPLTTHHTPGGGNPALAQAARNVLTSRHAIVIGPTPPGTGVIAPATL